MARLLLLFQQKDECSVASIDPGFGSAQLTTQRYGSIDQALTVLNPNDTAQVVYVSSACRQGQLLKLFSACRRGVRFLAAYRTDKSVNILMAKRAASVGQRITVHR